MSIFESLMTTGKAESFSKEYFNRYKGVEYSLRVVIWRGERYVLGYVRSYPNTCPSDGSTGFIVRPLAEVLAEVRKERQEHLKRLQEWKATHCGQERKYGAPGWSVLDMADATQEQYASAMAEVEVSDLQRSPALQEKALARYAEENDPTCLFSAWSSTSGVGSEYLESLLRLDRLLTAAGISHAPLCPQQTPQDFLVLGKDAVRAMVDMVRMQGHRTEADLQRIFENRWRYLEYYAAEALTA